MSEEQNAPGLEPAIEDLDATPDDAEGVVGGIGDKSPVGQNITQNKAKVADRAFKSINQYISE